MASGLRSGLGRTVLRLGDETGSISLAPLGNALNRVLGRRTRAAFGHTDDFDYRSTFFRAHPDAEGQVVVHHAVEQQVSRRYPGLVTEYELHSLENLRGIPNELNNSVHLSAIRKSWNEFYRTAPSPTRQQLLDKATEIDGLYGPQFRPPVG